ncbi:MAG: aspartate aminotransferase family protein, partial [Actinobacteria bacterium]|nr:aspartate aminotransferase family protein [Actinomycetota bacterium]
MSMIPLCDPTSCVAAGCTATVCVGKGIANNHALYTRSAEAIPGGVNSSIRAFKAVGGEPYIVARGEGAHIFDVEGSRYID